MVCYRVASVGFVGCVEEFRSDFLPASYSKARKVRVQQRRLSNRRWGGSPVELYLMEFSRKNIPNSSDPFLV